MSSNKSTGTGNTKNSSDFNPQPSQYQQVRVSQLINQIQNRERALRDKLKRKQSFNQSLCQAQQAQNQRNISQRRNIFELPKTVTPVANHCLAFDNKKIVNHDQPQTNLETRLNRNYSNQKPKNERTSKGTFLSRNHFNFNNRFDEMDEQKNDHNDIPAFYHCSKQQQQQTMLRKNSFMPSLFKSNDIKKQQKISDQQKIIIDQKKQKDQQEKFPSLVKVHAKNQNKKRKRIQKIKRSMDYYALSKKVGYKQYDVDIYQTIRKAVMKMRILKKDFPKLIDFRDLLCWINLTDNQKQLSKQQGLDLDLISQIDKCLIVGIQSYYPVTNHTFKKILTIPFVNLKDIRLQISNKNMRLAEQLDLSVLDNLKFQKLELIGHYLPDNTFRSLLKCKSILFNFLRLIFQVYISHTIFSQLLLRMRQLQDNFRVHLINDQNNDEDIQNRQRLVDEVISNFRDLYQKKRVRFYEGSNMNNLYQRCEIKQPYFIHSKAINQLYYQNSQAESQEEEKPQMLIDKKRNNRFTQNNESTGDFIQNSRSQVQKYLDLSEEQLIKKFGELSINEFNYYSKTFIEKMIEVEQRSIQLSKQNVFFIWGVYRDINLYQFIFDARNKHLMQSLTEELLKEIQAWDKRFISRIELYYDSSKLERIFKMTFFGLLHLTLIGIQEEFKIYNQQRNDLLNFLNHNMLNQHLRFIWFEGKKVSKSFILSFLNIHFKRLQEIQFIFQQMFCSQVVAILRKNPFTNLPKSCKIKIHLTEQQLNYPQLQKIFGKILKKRQIIFTNQYEQMMGLIYCEESGYDQSEHDGENDQKDENDFDCECQNVSQEQLDSYSNDQIRSSSEQSKP